MSSRVKWSSVLAFVPSQDRLTGRMGLSNGKPGHNIPKWT